MEESGCVCSSAGDSRRGLGERVLGKDADVRRGKG